MKNFTPEMTLAALIDHELSARVMTITQLASIADISPGSIHNLRHGRTNPRCRTLQRLAKVLEIPVTDLAKLAKLASSQDDGL